MEIYISELYNIKISKNKEAAPKFGSLYGQDIEPKGTYVISGHTPLNNYFKGTASLKKPLFIRIDNNSQVSYKHDLVKKYNAKGKTLTNKLMDKGFDAIITVYEDGQYGEIILLPNSSFYLK